MLYKEYIKIAALSVHKIGNKAAAEGVELSDTPVVLDKELGELKTFFLMAFKDDERYNFSHPTSLELNEVYSYLRKIFEDEEMFQEQSRNLAKFLYEKSERPNIKRGDLYIIYFKDCILDGETIDAIGLFKSENKDTYIQISPVAGGFCVESQTGMSIRKLDKGCLVFNILKRCEDDYNQTEQAVVLCKNFITKLPEKYDKATKAVMMNKVMESLNEKSVSLPTIANNAFESTGTSEAFYSYADEYQAKQGVTFKEAFQGKAETINRRNVCALTKIRLDSNFEINVLGGEENLVKGFDEERGKRFYTLYFEKER